MPAIRTLVDNDTCPKRQLAEGLAVRQVSNTIKRFQEHRLVAVEEENERVRIP
jgi:hypothetical protein